MSTAIDVDEVAMELNSVAIHLVRRLRRADRTLGVHPARLSALAVLVFGGPHTISELADAEQVTGPTMTRIVQGLERDGLAEREPDPDDRRAVRIRPTRRGRALMLRGRDQRVEQLAAQLRELRRDDLDILARAAAVLRRLEA
jgi:DNA-binding MarR family transcriptional regulator